ncbi:unnamed protein product, partial [Urochloa humidicola]
SPLRCKEVPTSFGFDIAGKIYSEMIGNVMTDARSTGEYYHCMRTGLSLLLQDYQGCYWKCCYK